MQQQMPGGTMGGGAGGPMMGMMGRGGMMSMMMGDHIEGRIAFLKAELKITDVQMLQWNAFADNSARKRPTDARNADDDDAGWNDEPGWRRDERA